MTEPKVLIQWLLDNKVAKTYFHKEYQEQMIEITDFGIEIHTILNQLKVTSEAAKKTNKIIEEKKKENSDSF